MNKPRILIRRKIRASSPQNAMKIIKTKYPFAKFIISKYDKDFRLVEDKERNYSERTLTIAFVDDYRKVLE